MTGPDRVPRARESRSHHPTQMPQIIVTPGASSSASSSSTPTKNSAKQPPRPQNAWILYRQWALTKLLQEEPELKGVPQAQLSKRLGTMWKEADSQVRGFFEHEANIRKEQHAVEHPNYVFKPVKRSVKESEREERKLEKARAKVTAKLEKQRRRASGRGSVTSSDTEEYPAAAFGDYGPSPPMSACPSRGGTPEPIDLRVPRKKSEEVARCALPNGYAIDSTLSWNEYRTSETYISESPVSASFPVPDSASLSPSSTGFFATEAFPSPPDSLSPVSPIFAVPDLLNNALFETAMPSITVAESFDELGQSCFDSFEISGASGFDGKGIDGPRSSTTTFSDLFSFLPDSS